MEVAVHLSPAAFSEHHYTCLSFLLHFSSRKCQSFDWPQHRLTCGVVTSSVSIKHKGTDHKVTLTSAMSGPELIEEILKQTKVSPCHMRLVTRGKLVTADNIWKLLFEVKDESRRKKLKFMVCFSVFLLFGYFFCETGTKID